MSCRIESSLLAAALVSLLLSGCMSFSAAAWVSEEPPALEATDAAVYVEHGDESARAQEYQFALEAYDEALRIDPGCVPAYIGRARVHNELQEYEAALADLDRVVELEPENAEWWIERGQCLWRLNEYERAVADLDRALELDPQSSWAYALRGDSRRLLDRHEEALEDLNLAIEITPEYPFALARLGETLRMLGRYEEAIDTLSLAIDQAPEDSFAYASRGQAYRELGDLERGLEDLDRALEIQPDYPWAAERRAELLAGLEGSDTEGPAAGEPAAGDTASGEAAAEEPGGGAAGMPSAAPGGESSTPPPLVAVLDFQVENLAASEGRLIVDLLGSALASTRAYRVLERSRRDALLKEIESSLQECADEGCQLQVGRMLSADSIVVGSLGRVGGRYILNTRLLEVETGEVLSTAYRVFKSLDELVDGCEEVAFALSGA